ncbi:MAG: SpoIIE family protein phosphatase [Streptosporangiaceae bacterium]|nr:SpoIIE family protein phosphatase [Streptosporangiaceae bacterium]MBV9854940.1 SpoIIE family protein phosphatase [Streptosporangiaceae bacterium]
MQIARNMSQGARPHDPLADLALRRDGLRQAAGIPGADVRALLDAVLTELDAAIDTLAERSDGGPGAMDAVPDTQNGERQQLRAAFQQAPVPLFLLERDGTIRRANRMAGELIGSAAGYATGKPLTVFIDLPSRAAVQTQLAAVARTGKTRQVDCRVLAPGGPADAILTADAISLPGDPPLLIVTLTAGTDGRTGAGGGAGQPVSRPRGPDAAGEAGNNGSPERSIYTMTHRMDMVTAVTRLLLDNSTFSEAVTLQRCARLLAGEIASWVIVDVERGGRLRRQFAIGPRDNASEDLARRVRSIDPEPGTVPEQVHSSRKPVLLAHAEDAGILGPGPGGPPLLMAIGATSVISVPISDGETSYGALTLARQAREGHFEIADLGLAEELGEHLAIAIRVDRMFRRRSEVAEALQASLLPARLPDVPGLELAAAYIAATQWQDISGDFYDVFHSQDGWAIALGDVCGKGQDAAAMTAAARHAIRALAHRNSDPLDVLRKANEVLLAGDYEDRFVTANLAFLRWEDRRLRVVLGSSGHPGPAVVRTDGRVEVLEGDGLPLGLFSDAEPNKLDLELGEGDLMFFYTDGVTDARGADMSYFQDRLADELAAVAGRSAAETVRAVQELVTAYSQDELRDDMTILVVKVGTRP